MLQANAKPSDDGRIKTVEEIQELINEYKRTGIPIVLWVYSWYWDADDRHGRIGKRLIDHHANVTKNQFYYNAPPDEPTIPTSINCAIASLTEGSFFVSRNYWLTYAQMLRWKAIKSQV